MQEPITLMIEVSGQANESPAVDPLGPAHPWSFAPHCQPACEKECCCSVLCFVFLLLEFLYRSIYTYVPILLWPFQEML